MVALTGLSLAIGKPGKELLGEREGWTSYVLWRQHV